MGEPGNVTINFVVPDGAEITATIHSHGALIKGSDNDLSLRDNSKLVVQKHYDSDLYSDSRFRDKQWPYAAKYSMYMAAPNGHLKRWVRGFYSPPESEDLCNCLPTLSNDPRFNIQMREGQRNLKPVYVVPVGANLRFGLPRKL